MKRRKGKLNAGYYNPRPAVKFTTEMVVFEWLKSASHPRFREVVALIK